MYTAGLYGQCNERRAIEEGMKKDSVAMGILKALSKIEDENLYNTIRIRWRLQ